MRVRRCAVLQIEPRDAVGFRLDRLAAGGTGLVAGVRLVALAPHLEREVEIDAAESAALGRIARTTWIEERAAARRVGVRVLRALIAKGLVVSDAAAQRGVRRRDDALRRAHWHGPAAVLHLLGRWRAIESGADADRAGLRTMVDLVGALGPPPPAAIARGPSAAALALPRAKPGPIDALLRRRVTCRNFDASRALPLRELALLLARVFGAQARFEIEPGVEVLKKNAPSGGGLHPIECYVIAQRVRGVTPGLYHYHALDHSLEPLRGPAPSRLGALARRALAGQDYFADAPALLVLSARFERTFWKYRNHSKAYRTIAIEVGLLSQLVYLTATELGLGAFVSAAINEHEVESAFGLDGVREGAMAISGVGARARVKRTAEFDPLGAVWPRP